MKCDTWLILMAVLAGWLILAMPESAEAQSAAISIVNSAHNLSAGGPGTVRAAGESEVCIFCHTPHNATPVKPLWNRALPATSYKTYESNSLKAKPGQPTGSSKLCLSCHDGTIALGSVNSRQQPIQMAGGITTLLPGAANLGTDLSDDHPISFVYDAKLASSNGKLKDPSMLPAAMRLDADKNLQCTTCHDAHDNRYGNFLVMSNKNSELCNTCHTMSTAATKTDITEHTLCDKCHQTHTAPSGPYLLTRAKVSDTCMVCHNGVAVGAGAVQGPNLIGALNSAYPHDTKSPVNLPDQIPHNVDCKDCHDPHTMKSSGAAATAAPGISGSMGTINGINSSGLSLARARYDYEVCLKCHGEKSAKNPTLSRQTLLTNMRLQFAPSAVSFHPVAAKGKNFDVPSLRPPYTVDSMMSCMDCHGSDSSKKAGGTGANGPHGSNYPGMLLARYDTGDFTPYSTAAYALCFTCHDNTKVVANSGPFPLHQSHVDNDKAPCATCHDSHGVGSAQGTTMHNAALINFNTSIVQPDEVNHRIDFTHTGSDHGTCTLKCHGRNHTATPY